MILNKKRFQRREVTFIQGLDGNYRAIVQCNVAEGALFGVPLSRSQGQALLHSNPSIGKMFPTNQPDDSPFVDQKNYERCIADPNFRAQWLFHHGQTPAELFITLHRSDIHSGKHVEPLDLSKGYGYLKSLSELERQTNGNVRIESLANRHTVAAGKIIAFEHGFDNNWTAKCFCNELDCEVHLPVTREQMNELLIPDRRIVQEILPETDKQLREIFLSGLTPAEFDRAFSGRLQDREEYRALGYKLRSSQERASHETIETRLELGPASNEHDHTKDQEHEHEM